MRSLWIPVAAALVVAPGCFKQRSLIGSWELQRDARTPRSVHLGITFHRGGYFSTQMGIPWNLEDGTWVMVRSDTNGSWKLTDYVLETKAKQTVSTVFLNGVDETPKFPEVVRQFDEHVQKSWIDEPNSRFDWVDDNTFTVTGADGTKQTFKRRLGK
jgi:hypothetical protein